MAMPSTTPQTFTTIERVLVTFSVTRRIDNLVRVITEAAPPKNRRLLCAMAQHQAPFGQLADAAFGLSYCFARTYFVAGGAKARRGKRLTVEILERAAKPYSITADYYGYVQSPGFWARHENEDITWTWAIRAIRWSYNDQVARWQKGLGVKLSLIHI